MQVCEFNVATLPIFRRDIARYDITKLPCMHGGQFSGPAWGFVNLQGLQFAQKFLSTDVSQTLTNPLSDDHCSLSEVVIDEEDVLTALLNLDPTKATGCDGIGPKILTSSLYKPLHRLFTMQELTILLYAFRLVNAHHCSCL